MEGLRDIKGLVLVDDSSFYYFLAVVITMLLLTAIGIYLAYKHLSKKGPLTHQGIAQKALKDFEFDGSKKSIYTFTHLAQYAVNEQQNAALQELLEQLAPYKYHQEEIALEAPLFDAVEKMIKELRHG